MQNNLFSFSTKEIGPSKS